MIDATRFEYLQVTVDDEGVAQVVLNRPPVNAVNRAMYAELFDLFSDIDRVGPGIRAVVLTGAGRHFCAGNELDDFESMTPANAPERMFHVREAFFAIRECAVPVVGAIGGAALGTGLALAASCDFVVAADDARFGLPELSVGVMGGAKHLSRMVSEPVMRWMFLTGTRVPASALQAWGGVISVVGRDALVADATEIARTIAGFSPKAVRLSKQGLNTIEFLDTRRGYEQEQGLTARMSGHPDAKSALRAVRAGLPITFSPVSEVDDEPAG